MYKYYLYRHIRLDKNEPFYIGIGTKAIDFNTYKTEYRRAYDFVKRSEWWKKIHSKTNIEVNIILESNDYDFIKNKEIEFIKLYGRRNLNSGILINLTQGGEGILGYRHTADTKAKMSENNKGKTRGKGRKLSTITKERISQSRIKSGVSRKQKEQLIRLHLNNKGKKQSDYQRKIVGENSKINNVKPVKVKDIINNEILQFPSIKKMREFLKIKSSSGVFYFKNRLYKKRYILKYNGE